MKNTSIFTPNSSGDYTAFTPLLHRFYTAAMIVAFIMYSTVAFAQVSNCDCDFLRLETVTTSSLKEGFVFNCTRDKYKVRICNDNIDCPAENVVITIELPVGVVPTNLNGFTATGTQITKSIGGFPIIFDVYTKTISIGKDVCVDEFIEGKGVLGSPNAVLLGDEIGFFASIGRRTVNGKTCTDKVEELSSPFAYGIAQELSGNGANFLAPSTVVASLACDPVFNAGRTYVVTDNLDLTSTSITNLTEYCINDSRIFVKPNVKITLKSTKLNIHASVFRSCENEMWDGIDAKDGWIITDNVVQLGTPNTGKMEIYDAKIAIDCAEEGAVDLRDTKFIDNYIGVRADHFYRDAIDISSCTFKGTGQLKPAQGLNIGNIPYAGISITYRSLLKVGNSSFTNMANGIINDDSFVSIGNSNFIDMRSDQPSYPKKGYGIYSFNYGILNAENSNFDNCQRTSIFSYFMLAVEVVGGQIKNSPTGIYASRVERFDVSGVNFVNIPKGINAIRNNKFKMKVLNNTFTNGNHIGIILHFNTYENKGLIKGNNMTLSGTAAITSSYPTYGESFTIEDNPKIHFNGTNAINISEGQNVLIQRNHDIKFGNGEHGVNFEGGRDNTAFCNTINTTATNNTLSGLRVAMSGKPLLSCNTVNYMYERTGIRFDGVSIMTDFAANTMNSNAPNNTAGTGLRLDQLAMIGEQKYQGNKFLRSGATTENPDVAASRFIVWNGGGNPPPFPELIPQFVNIPAGTTQQWFRNVAPGPADFQKRCESKGTTCVMGTVLATDIPPRDGEIFTDGIVDGLFPVASNWIMRNQYFNFLKQNPEELAKSPQTVKNLYQNLQQSDIGKLYEVSVQMNTLYKGNTVAEDTRVSLETLINTSLALIKNLNVQLSTASADAQLSIKLQRKNELAHLNELQEQMGANNAVIQTQVDTKIAAIDALNSSFSTEILPAQNEQSINHIYLETIAKDVTTLSSADRNALVRIAFQCPFQGGNAVYRARAIHDYLLGDTDYGNTCVGITPKMQANGTHDDTVLYPNPAADYIMLNMPTSYYETNLSVSFVNSQGVLAMQQNTSAVERISTATLPNGFYTCVIKDASTGATLKAQKIIILKN
jgi:hypothetical protein